MGVEISIIAVTLADRINGVNAKTDREGRFYLCFNLALEDAQSESNQCYDPNTKRITSLKVRR